jgi:hypothetical protein
MRGQRKPWSPENASTGRKAPSSAQRSSTGASRRAGGVVHEVLSQVLERPNRVLPATIMETTTPFSGEWYDVEAKLEIQHATNGKLFPAAV